MGDDRAQTTTGPIEDRTWPDKLRAHVVEPGPSPRLHGFDVQADLARHYRFGEVLLIALTGEAPDEETGRAFDVALTFAAPAPIHEAPSHAAMLARVCGSRPSSIVAVAAITITEQARALLDEHEAFLTILAGDGSRGDVPGTFGAHDETERQAVERFRGALGPFQAHAPALSWDVGLDAAILGVMFACGLRSRPQLETALCVARLGIACVEALATTAGAFREYPIDLPRFEYQGGNSG